MCLDRISKEKFTLKKENNHFVGYKLFRKDPRGRLRAAIFNLKVVLVNQWVKEKKYRMALYSDYIELGSFRYKKGFHVFLDLNDALIYQEYYIHLGPIIRKNTIVRKVYFRKVVAQGYQKIRYKNMAVVVAKEMFVPPLEGGNQCASQENISN